MVFKKLSRVNKKFLDTMAEVAPIFGKGKANPFPLRCALKSKIQQEIPVVCESDLSY